MFGAVKVALAPAPAQGRRLASHAGGAGFAYNTMLAHVKCSIDKGEKPWWRENSKEGRTATGWSLLRKACLIGQKSPWRP